MVEALGGIYTLETLVAWTRGNRDMSAIGADHLANVIEARLRAGTRLLTELRAYSANRALRPKAGPGFRAIDPETGLSGRPRVGRKRKVKEV
jgi:hypothetical protein